MGNVSYRTPSRTTYFAHFTPPSYSIGCGGIDAQFGGFDFLGVDEIVKSFQRIMQAAPAFAFKLALEQLCAPCGQVIQTLQALSDMLNELSINECDAAKALGTGIGDVVANSEALKSFKGEGEATHWIKRQKSMIQDWTKNIKEYKEKYLGPSVCGSDENCLEMFFETGSMWNLIAKGMGTKESSSEVGVWWNVVSAEGPVNRESEFVWLVRGMSGDVLCTKPQEETRPDKQADEPVATSGQCTYIPGNTYSARELAEAMLEVEVGPAGPVNPVQAISEVIKGKRFKEEIPFEGRIPTLKVFDFDNFYYEKVDLTSATLEEIAFGVKADKHIENIIKAMEDRGAIGSDDIDFITQQGLPLYSILNTYSLYGTAANDSAILKKVAAVSHAYYFLDNVCKKAIGEAYKHYSTIKLVGGEKQMVFNTKERREEILKVISMLKDLKVELSGEYDKRLTELNRALVTLAQYRLLDEKVRQSIKNAMLVNQRF